MKEKRTQANSHSLWQTTAANLLRYKPSGTYFARLRVAGKLIRRTLRTQVLTVARLRLRELEQRERRRAEITAAPDVGQMNFAGALRLYRERLDQLVTLKQLKPATREYREECIARLLKVWPRLETLDVRRISKADCAAAAGKLKGSATAFNNTIGTLRAILEISVEAGVRYDNPARFVKRVRVRPTHLALPSTEQFLAFVAAVEGSKRSSCYDAADLIRFLTYGGFRKSEAARVTWADCDSLRGEIVVKGDPDTGTKNWNVRRVPMIAEMRELLAKLRKERPDEPGDNPVMPIRECQGSIDRTLERLKEQGTEIPRLTHHDFRHLFATRCIESGVDVPTVSRWLGHKDGGALAMKVYGHLRDAHSASMARRVHFQKPAGDNVVELAQAAEAVS